jgi:cytochrome P450
MDWLMNVKNAHFIFGHIGSQLGPDRGGFYERITREVPNAGLIRVKGLFQDQVLLTDPKAFTEILVSKSYEFPKPESSRKFLEYLIGNGLVVAEGPTHKKQRKHILPSFGFRSIKNLYPLFWAKAIQMTSAISQSAFEPCRKRESNLPSGVIDIEYWAPKATLDIIGTAGLGRDFDTLGGSADELARLYERLTTATPEESRHAMLYMLLGELIAKILMPKTARGIRQITQELRKFSELFVREKRGQLAKGIDQPADTLASLMASGVFSDEDLVDQLLTILAAG